MLWLAVTPDKYELPIAVAATARELSILMGLHDGAARQMYHRQSTGKIKDSRSYKVVKVDDTEV